MKLVQNTIQKISYFLLLLMFLISNSSCEGLDDWSDLQNADFLGLNNSDKEDAFKRYSIPGLSSEPLVEYIVDNNTELSREYCNQIRKACDYSKIPFKSTKLSTWNATLKIAPTTRVLSVLNTIKLNDASIAKILDFVINGGTLFLPYANEDHRMNFLLGFTPLANFATDDKSQGWLFSTPMLPCLKGKTYSEKVIHFGFDAQNFSNKVKILAVAKNNPKYPAVVENSVGRGKVLLYNTSGYFIKADRGFLFAGILKGLEGIPYPVANAATIFLDDFPSPQYDIYAEPIKSELNLTMNSYVKKVWWPDMLTLANEYKIPYAAMLTFDYRNKIVPPFTLDQWNVHKVTYKGKMESLTDWYVKDCKKNGHELAFHGYNHVSLTKEDWKGTKFMGTALNTVKKKWEISNYAQLPTSYVPPSNIIDKDGLVELKKALPSIKYLCSLYLGIVSDGGNREFDYDPLHKDIFDYPRISSGFYLEDDDLFNQQSMYLFTGIWTHFVHPDDVFQIPATANKTSGGYGLRNSRNYGWYKTKGSDKSMFGEFKKLLKQQSNTFPQMRFLSANDASRIVIDWRASRYTHKAENGFYTVKEINPAEDKKQYWFMYGSPENADRIESQLKSQDVLYAKSNFMDGTLYSVFSTKTKLTMVDLNYKGPKEKANQALVTQRIKASIATFNVEAKNYQTGVYWDQLQAKKEKIDLEALKNKLLNSTVIDSVQWNKYAKRLSWDEKGDEVWKMLEDFVAKYPTKQNVMYSKELDRLIGYPNDLTREKWMSAQLLFTPNDKDLLNSYVANFNTPENQEKIKNALLSLLKVDTSGKSYKSYIKFLLENRPDEALAELRGKKPVEELAEFASTIVWLFVDNNEYLMAYDWSALSNEIDFVTKMNWLIEQKDYKMLEKEYNIYIESTPGDYKAVGLMSNVYHELGRLKDSWILANSMPESPEKEEMRKILNKDIVYEKPELIDYLVQYQSELFYPNVLKSIIKDDRLENGNFVELLSSLQTNQADPSIFKNIASYNFYDSKKNIHTISATFDKFYKLEILQKYTSNFANSLMGAQYKFTTAVKEGKPQYWSRARVEVDKKTNPYFQFGIGANYSKDKRFRASELNIFPVETAPGMNQKMYQARLNLYQESYLFKKLNLNIAFESNYYTNGQLSRDTIPTEPVINPNRFSRKSYNVIDEDNTEVITYDDALDAAVTLKMLYNNGKVKKSKLLPYLEVQYSLGTRDQSNGYPYWMIKNRLYGGLGLGWELGLKNFKTNIEAGYFLDDYSDNFQRVTVISSYQIFDYTSLTLDLELFAQSKYYSNSVQFGIKHNLKKKKKVFFK